MSQYSRPEAVLVGLPSTLVGLAVALVVVTLLFCAPAAVIASTAHTASRIVLFAFIGSSVLNLASVSYFILGTRRMIHHRPAAGHFRRSMFIQSTPCCV